MKNAFTVDLEEWFCSHNLKAAIKFNDWEKLESRIEKNTHSLLDLLNRNKTKATFFALGWVAERYPNLIKTIYNEGHEIASHGYAHQQITLQTQRQFEIDIKQSVQVLEGIIGRKPIGYRAPAFSITKETQWALPILRKHGFKYDSSVYPFSLHPDYGDERVPLSIYSNAGLIEIPLSCASIGRFRMPCSGGAYLRFYPYQLFILLARRVVKQERPFIFYIHPWEIDETLPKVKLQFSKSLRHYYNTSSTFVKIERLIKEFEFTTIQRSIAHESF